MISVEELAQLPVFEKISPEKLAYLARSVPDIRVAPGEYIVNEGDALALYVVIEGRFEVTKIFEGIEHVIGQRVRGALFGAPSFILGTPFPAALRALEQSCVIRLEPRVFRTFAAAAPEFATAVQAAAEMRIEWLRDISARAPITEIQVIGPRWNADVQALRDYLHGNRVSFDFLTPEEATGLGLQNAASMNGRYPLLLFSNGTQLIAPSPREVASALGLAVKPAHADYDVLIIGSGPAGLAAAVYGVSEGLRTMLIERLTPGGQAGTSSRIENYLGFPFGVSGDELASRALTQAKRLGAEVVVTRSVESIDVAARQIILDGGDTLHARSMILAMGVTWRHLAGVKLQHLAGKGVYYGASRSEANWVMGEDVFLVGGGNSAGQAALFFASYARSVTLLVRGDDLGRSMSHYLTEQLKTKANVVVSLNSEVTAVTGTERLESIDIIDRATGLTTRRAAAALFILIGADASTDWLPDAIARDTKGFILTGSDATRSGHWGEDRDPYLLETAVPGIFAVGDVRAGSIKRIASGVGEGSMAIAFVHKYLQSAGL